MFDPKHGSKNSGRAGANQLALDPDSGTKVPEVFHATSRVPQRPSGRPVSIPHRRPASANASVHDSGVADTQQPSTVQPLGSVADASTKPNLVGVCVAQRSTSAPGRNVPGKYPADDTSRKRSILVPQGAGHNAKHRPQSARAGVWSVNDMQPQGSQRPASASSIPEAPHKRRGLLSGMLQDAIPPDQIDTKGRHRPQQSYTINPEIVQGRVPVPTRSRRSSDCGVFASWANWHNLKHAHPAEHSGNGRGARRQQTARGRRRHLTSKPPLPTKEVPWRRCISDPGTVYGLVDDDGIIPVPVNDIDPSANLESVDARAECLCATSLCPDSDHVVSIGMAYDQKCQQLYIKPNSGILKFLQGFQPCGCKREIGDFRGMLLGDRGIHGLLHIVSFMPSLRFLNLAGNSLRDGGLRATLSTLQHPGVVPKLLVLDLSGNPIGSWGADALEAFLRELPHILLLGTSNMMMCSLRRRRLMAQILATFSDAPSDNSAEALSLSGEGSGFQDTELRAIASDVALCGHEVSDAHDNARPGAQDLSSHIEGFLPKAACHCGRCLRHVTTT